MNNSRQLGFDLEYTDAVTQKVVPWAMPDDKLIETIEAAKWKIVDVETTGLNPASKEINFTAKNIRRGVDPTLRLRILSLLVPSVIGSEKPYFVYAFDFDQLTLEEKKQIAKASMTNVVIAHNAGFDGYWIRTFTKQTPTKLLDSMLIARVMRPEHLINLAKMCNDENEDFEIRKEAEAVFMQSRTGWSLADLSLGILRKVVSKEMQGPRNWAEPFLSQKSYDYATGDTITLLEILMELFGISDCAELLTRYEELAKHNKALRMIEPQVLDIIEMREHGMPWSSQEAKKYIKSQSVKVRELAEKLIDMEPSLEEFRPVLIDLEKGITADLKAAIGKCFTSRGITLEMTDKANTFKIGEKDLRRVKAQVSETAKELFDTWIGLTKAKKTIGMAKEVSAYAERSGDDRLHPNTGHGPVTGRLASSEPNCQQFPRDQGFRNCVTARPGYKIVASDYSALDMRVGAALAIRAQRQIFDAYMGDYKCEKDVLKVISDVFEGRTSVSDANEEEVAAIAQFTAWKQKREEVSEDGTARKKYWERYRELSRAQLLAGFKRCLIEVRVRAEQEQTTEWGSLRDAFNIAGMDIHSWTALGMIGKDPKGLFLGLEGAKVAEELKKWKKELGDNRQTGKVGNLSLLYAMKTLGLVDAAAKNYNIHWTFDAGDKVRIDWLSAYVEIDLWHKWTELNPFTSVYVPDSEKGGKYAKKDVYKSVTLGGRVIYAFGLNAALSYEDQSTGADILGRVMETLRIDHPSIFEYTVNQVHDELVFEIPDEKVAEYTDIIQKVMTEAAEYFLMPYGVKGECTPAIGQVWVKD